jgi:hypothetical protein
MSVNLIDKTECMGDSLAKINSNFSYLDSATTWLSGNYIPRLLVSNTTSQNSAVKVNLTINNLTINVPGAAYAWCVNTGATINRAYNITSVANPAGGTYVYTLTNPVSSADYCVVATADSTSQGRTSHVVSTSATGFTVHVRNSDSIPYLINADKLNVAVFF